MAENSSGALFQQVTLQVGRSLVLKEGEGGREGEKEKEREGRRERRERERGRGEGGKVGGKAIHSSPTRLGHLICTYYVSNQAGLGL